MSLTQVGPALISSIAGVSGGGKLLQTITTVKLDTFSTTSTSMTDVTGLSVQITPSSTSSKILVTGAITGAGNHFVWCRILRDSTQLQTPPDLGNRAPATIVHNGNNVTHSLDTLPISILDSPSSTSQLTYKVQIMIYLAASYINRSTRDENNTGKYDSRGSSSITVQEISE
tara:strand:+ start:1006 stop:1521 length:516 start_codon:yes stop_codon:yes gene_type:complete